MVHEFSHNQSYDYQNLSAESKVAQDKVDTKNTVDKKSNKESKDSGDFCLICHLASFYQNNILLADSIILVASSLYLLHLFSLKNKVKLSYLLRSYQSQAPPAIL